MNAYLKIDCYADHYGVDSLGCVDQPIAGAAGFYNYHNYFYYACLLALEKNWSNDYSNIIFSIPRKNKVLSKIGLKLVTNITSNDELIPDIYKKLEHDIPVVLITTRRSLIYSYSYNRIDETNHHGILVSGFNSNRNSLVIRDVAHIEASGIQFEKYMYGLFKLFIKSDVVKEIWETSNDTYIEDKSELIDKFFSVEEVGSSDISSYNDLITTFITDYNPNNNLFIEYIKDINSISIDDDLYFTIMMNNYYHTLIILFDIFDKVFLSSSEDIVNQYSAFKGKYLKHRYKLISLLHMKKIRSKIIDIDDISNEILMMDKELFETIKYLNNDYNVANYSNENSDLINYAINATATCDSELHLHPPHDALNHDRESSWKSSTYTTPHWLQLDLGTPRNISKAIIYHFENPALITKEFTLQACDDGITWEDLVCVTDNKDYINEFELDNANYRYFRILITYPCINDYMARIHNISLLGD